MEEATVFLGLTDLWNQALPSSPYSVAVNGEGESLSGDELKSKLLTFFQNFKSGGAERVRYIIVYAPDKDNGLLFFDTFNIIQSFYQKVILLPFEVEAFIPLPSVGSDSSAKAGCYRFFKAMEDLASDGLPLFLWLLDMDRLPHHLLGDLLSVYLSTDVYRAFNAQAQMGDYREKPRYSSLGTTKLIFSAQTWHDYLSCILVRDILSASPLSPLKVSMETAQMALSQVFPFLKTNLNKVAKEIIKPASFSQADVLIEGLATDEEEGMEKFLARLKLHINQEKARQWEETKPHAEIFCQEVRREFYNILDKSPHGPYAAWGFIGLMLASGGPYVEFFKDIEVWPKELAGMSLQSFLFGCQEGLASPVLDLIFSEVIENMRKIYLSRHLPFPKPSTWKALIEELNRLLDLPELEEILGKSRNFLLALKDKTEAIVDAEATPYTSPLAAKHLEDILELLEAQAREYLKETIEEIRPVREKLQELEEKIASTGLLKWLPFFWHLFFQKWAQKSEYDKAKTRLREAYLDVLERRQRLFACYLAPFVADQLCTILRPLEDEIKAFVLQLQETESCVKEKIKETNFKTPAFGFQVVEDETETKSLYHHKVALQDIPELFDEFLKGLKELGEPLPKLSHFYTPRNKRQEFFKALHTYSFSKFAWIADWDVARAISHLKKNEKMAIWVEKKSAPFLHVKLPIPTNLRTSLFIGFDSESRSPFSASAFSPPAPFFYSHGNPELITGLKLCHGFPISAIEGWDHWKACAQEEEKE